MSINRRSLFKAGAFVGTVALAAPQIMTRAAIAAVPTSNVTNPGFYRFTMGKFEITVILDGARPFDGPYPIFGADQQAADVEALMEANFLPTTRMIGQFNPVLVNTGTDLILFDAGMGVEGRGAGMGQLTNRMAASRYSPTDVTIVVITHMHGDHINGLMEGDRPAFVGARYVFGRTEWVFWTSSDRAGTAVAGNAEAVRTKVVPLQYRMTLIGDNARVADGITGTSAAGHTPGHMVFMLESAGRNLVLTGVTANHFVASLQRPDCQVSLDMDKKGVAEARKKIFGMPAADKMPFVGYHMPHLSFGFIEPLCAGFRFVPASYQFAI